MSRSDHSDAVNESEKSRAEVLSGDTGGSSTIPTVIENGPSHQRSVIDVVPDVTSSHDTDNGVKSKPLGGTVESNSIMSGNREGIERLSSDVVSGGLGISSNGLGLRGGQKDVVEFVNITAIRLEVEHDIAQLKSDDNWVALCEKIKAMTRQKKAVFCLELVVEIQKSQSVGYVNEIKKFRELYQSLNKEQRALTLSDSVFYTSNDFLYESVDTLAVKACSVDNKKFLSAWVKQFAEGGKNLTDREIQFIGQLTGVRVIVVTDITDDGFDSVVVEEGARDLAQHSVTIRHCPGHYERIENLDGERVAFQTEGDGYCALHAAFGHSMKRNSGVQHAKGNGGQKARVSEIVKVSDLVALKSDIVKRAQALIEEMKKSSDWSKRYPSFDTLKKDVLALTYTHGSHVDEGYRRTLRALNMDDRIRQQRVRHRFNIFKFSGAARRHLKPNPLNAHRQLLISTVDQLVDQMGSMSWEAIQKKLQLGVRLTPSLLEQCVIHLCVHQLGNLLHALHQYCQKDPLTASQNWNSVFSIHATSLPTRRRWFDLLDLLLAKPALFTLLVGGMNKPDRLKRAANSLDIRDDYRLCVLYNDLSVFVYVAWKNGDCLPILSKDFTTAEILSLLSTGLKAIDRVIKRGGMTQQPHFKGRFLYHVLQLAALSGCDISDLASLTVYKKDVADYVIFQNRCDDVLGDKQNTVYRFLNITNGLTHPEESATIKKLKGDSSSCVMM